jgi:hypothetical protein
MVNIVGSSNMLRAPGNPVPGAGHVLDPSANEALPASPEDCTSVGAVMSEQAVMTPAAMMAIAMRRWRWIMGVPPEMREEALGG